MVLFTENNEQDSGDFSARKADLIDKHVGQRLRDRRRALDMSQQDIAQILGISYQQVQKYECGLNRISAGRLFMLSHIMSIPVTHFYDGLPPAEDMLMGKIDVADVMMPNVDTLPNANIRDALTDLVRAIRDSKMM
ncbi:MAG: helix-turn-helix domain-containing protein [Kordiimonas sp.]